MARAVVTRSGEDARKEISKAVDRTEIHLGSEREKKSMIIGCSNDVRKKYDIDWR